MLPTVRDRLRDAEARLAAPSDTDDDMWMRLDDAGLVGDALKLKIAIWRNTASTPQAQTPKRFVGRGLAPLLKLVNSILGGLSGVLPGVELVKEYKEGVEVLSKSRTGPRHGPVRS